MSSVSRIFNKIFFWNYGRSAWQYDVLCVLILAFIFLTPKSWFEHSEPRFSSLHQNSSTASLLLLVEPRTFPTAAPDANELEKRVRAATNRPDAKVKEVRPVRDEQGRTIAYEVDIR